MLMYNIEKSWRPVGCGGGEGVSPLGSVRGPEIVDAAAVAL